MKIISKIFSVLAFVLCLNCGTSDEGESQLTLVNKALIVGDWIQLDYCEEQNKITFNSDLTFEELDSSNQDCLNNESSTYQYIGSYNIIENQIFFNIVSQELVIEGTGLSVSEFQQSIITHTLNLLNESELTIFTTIVTGFDTHSFSRYYIK